MPGGEAVPARGKAAPIIDLSLGDPGFPAPPLALQAAARATQTGVGGYAPMGGVPALRDALAAKLRRVNGFLATKERVVVTSGASQAIFATLATLCRAGDQVLVPEPGFPLYRLAVQTLGLDAVGYPLRRDLGYAPDWTEIRRRAATARIMLWNFPSNPLGTVGRADWYESLYAVLAEFPDLHVINDAVYEDLCLDSCPDVPVPPHPGVADRVLSVFSFSKGYALTGWRVGYLHTTAALAQRIARAHWGMSMSSSTVGQLAALAALAAPDDYLAGNRALLRGQRDTTVDALLAMGLECERPEAGLFAWVGVAATGHDDTGWVTHCARQARVILSPGTDFAPSATDRIRFCFAGRRPQLAEALRRIAAWGELGWRVGDRGLVRSDQPS